VKSSYVSRSALWVVDTSLNTILCNPKVVSRYHHVYYPYASYFLVLLPELENMPRVAYLFFTEAGQP